MVSGSRHRNSTTRTAHGTLIRTQIIVGTSSSSIPATVSAASSRDVRIACRSWSFAPIAFHESHVEGFCGEMRVL